MGLSPVLSGPMGPHCDFKADVHVQSAQTVSQGDVFPTQVSLGGVWLSIVLIVFTNLLTIIFSIVLTWRSQMNHITISHIDGPVLIANVENLNQVSWLGFFKKLQEKNQSWCGQASRQQQRPWLGSCSSSWGPPC